MVNLFSNMLKENNNKRYDEYLIKSSKHFPSSTREWNSAIYTYNKTHTNSIPNTVISSVKLLKSYFSLFNNLIEQKIRIRKIRSKFRKLSSNKIYISNGQFKHTNNRVIITLFIFDRQKHNYMYFLRKVYLNAFFNVFRNKKKKVFKYFFLKRLGFLKQRSNVNVERINKEKFNILKLLKNSEYAHMYAHMSKYIDNFHCKFVNKSLNKIKLYFMYRQVLLINRSKYNYNFLQYLKGSLYEIFNKNIEFNLVNLKQFYLNSDILSESLLLKLSKNRRKILKFMSNIRNKVKIHKRDITHNKYLHAKDKLDLQKDLTSSQDLLRKNIINSLKYKNVSGFRIEAKGRLSKRYTASRSVLKTKYKGNLLNIDSSYKGLSSVLLKGNLKSNVQNTKLWSKSRIGSFGIKGWVSGN